MSSSKGLGIHFSIIVALGAAGYALLIWLSSSLQVSGLFMAAAAIAGAFTLISASVAYHALSSIRQSQQLTAGQLQRIAGGDLETPVRVDSQDADELTASIEQARAHLQQTVNALNQGILQVAASAQQLYASADQSSQGSAQVAEAIQAVALQSENQLRAVEDATRAISKVDSQIADSANSLNGLAQSAVKATGAVETGAVALEEVVRQMGSIRTTVTDAADTIEQLGRKSEQIGQIINTIAGIASQTGLLSLNASIEAARAITAIRHELNVEMDKHMVSAARLLAIHLRNNPSMTPGELTALIHETGLEEVWVTDWDGVVTMTNIPNGIGFRFPEKGQAAEFRAILGNRELVVCQEPAQRDIDGQIFKYIGVSRKDQPGILQLGIAFRQRDVEKVSAGFSVVAEEVRKLAEETSKASRHIAGLISEIQQKTAEAVAAMETGTRQANTGNQLAAEAGRTFEEINALANQVSQAANKLSDTMKETAEHSRNIIGAVRVIEDAVRNNTEQTETASAATQQQLASAQEITAASQALANLSETLRTRLSAMRF